MNKTAISGIGDGVSTAFGSIIPVLPFLFLDKQMAMIVAILITLLILFILGIFIGKISKENLVISGFKMVIGGLLVAIISFIIEQII